MPAKATPSHARGSPARARRTAASVATASTATPGAPGERFGKDVGAGDDVDHAARYLKQLAGERRALVSGAAPPAQNVAAREQIRAPPARESHAKSRQPVRRAARRPRRACTASTTSASAGKTIADSLVRIGAGGQRDRGGAPRAQQREQRPQHQRGAEPVGKCRGPERRLARLRREPEEERAALKAAAREPPSARRQPGDLRGDQQVQRPRAAIANGQIVPWPMRASSHHRLIDSGR